MEPIQLNCFGMGYSRKKNKQGGFEDILFWSKPWNSFCFSLYCWKFQTKQSSTPGILVKLCMLLHLLEISNQILHEFFLISLGNFTLFLINPWKLCTLFYKYSLKFYILTLPPCHHIFWNSPILKTLC